LATLHRLLNTIWTYMLTNHASMKVLYSHNDIKSLAANKNSRCFTN